MLAISIRRSCGAVLSASIALAPLACSRPPEVHHAVAVADAEWVSGPTDLRKMTAIIRVTPPAKLRAAFESMAARSDDEDAADFFRAHAGGGFGSGFLVVHRSAGNEAAFVVTNRHVVGESEDAEITFGDGTTYKNCEIVYSSPKYDLAVLALPDTALRAFGYGFRPAPREPSDRLTVIAAGYPGFAGKPSYQVTDGKISNARFSMDGEPPLVQHTAAIDPGSSGGPLTDEAGALVGANVMIARKRQSMSFAVPAAAIVETVRHAHDLATRKREAAWMTQELDTACRRLSSELASSAARPDRVDAFVSNRMLGDRGMESYVVVTSHPKLAPIVRPLFYRDPITGMRTSVVLRLAMRADMGGGTTGTCSAIHPGDSVAITEGKAIRLSMNTKSGADMELAWAFEHGSWRVVDGEMITLRAAATEVEAPSPPTSAPATKKPAAKAAAKSQAKTSAKGSR